MKVMQLIDSLDSGGAERMAVTIANGLVPCIDSSYLCATRKEGLLHKTLDPKVGYLFLQRKKTLDLTAFKKLNRFVKKEKITVIHAHGTSYFLAAWLKIRQPKLIIIWHEHYGNRIYSKLHDFKTLYFCSHLFSKIITVNKELQSWCEKNLKAKEVHYLRNFISMDEFLDAKKDSETNTIVCLANLRVPKNHHNLLEAFTRIRQQYPDWKLILIGKDYEDVYSKALHTYIAEHDLESSVVFTGEIPSVATYLASAKIGVLASDVEGLPMALLEYGAAKLAVISTDVGYTKEVMSTFGKTVPTKNPEALAEALKGYILNTEKREKDAKAFHEHVKNKYTTGVVIKELIELYK